MKAAIKIFLSLILFIEFSFSQEAELYFTNYSINNSSISSNTITSIVEDNNSFIWLGSGDGVIRFDGYHFKNYKLPSSPNFPNLTPYYIPYLCVDKKGNLIVQGQNNIYYYDVKSDAFKIVKHSDKHLSQLYHNIYVDNNDFIWTESEDNIMYFYNDQIVDFTPSNNTLYDPKNWHLYKYFISKHTLPSKVSEISKNEAFNFLYKTIYNHYYNSKKELTSRILDIQVDQKNNYYFLIEDYAIKANITHNTSEIVRFNDSKTKNNLPNKSFTIDKNNNLWTHTSTGISEINNTYNNQFHYTNKPREDYLINEYAPFDMFVDSNNNLWIGYDQGGLSVTNLSLTHKFESYKLDPSIKSKYKGYGINSIAENKDGLLIIGSEQGVTFYDQNNNNYVNLFPEYSKILNKHIICIFIDEQKERLYISTIDEICVFDLKEKKLFKKFDFASRTIRQTKDNKIWILTMKKGFLVFDKSLEDFEYVLPKNDTPNYKKILEIGNIHVDEYDNLWLANNELFYIDQNTKRAIKIRLENDTNQESEISNLIRIKNVLWLSTYQGLLKLSLNEDLDDLINKTPSKQNTTTRIFKNNALQNRREIYSMVKDENNNLWLTIKNKGITRFNTEDESFDHIVFGSNDKYFNFNQRSFFKNKDGKLFFGCTDDVISFYPKDIVTPTPNLNVKIIDLKIFNKSVIIKKKYNDRVTLPQNISETKALVLSHEDKSFSLEFTTPVNYGFRNEIYAYKLEGFDKDWIYTNSKNRIVTYTNLDANTYSFRVKSSANSKDWGSETVLNIKITAPFWATVYAKIFYALLILAFGYAVYRYISIKLEKKNLEQVSQLRMNYFSNISHELRTPLTLILGPLENILPKIKNNSWLTDQMQTINQNANRLLRLVNQLLILKKLEQNHLKLEVLEGDIVAYVKDIYHSFSSYAEQKNITYQFKCSVRVLNIYFDADKVEKILSNLLSNAFNYTPKDGVITIELALHSTSDTLQIKVNDSGVGIPKDKVAHIFNHYYSSNDSTNYFSSGIGIGLALTKKLVELHHGDITVESSVVAIKKIKRGTSFTVILPTSKEIYNNSEIVKHSVQLKANPIEKRSPLSEILIEDSIKAEATDNTFTILIVEDSLGIRLLLKEILKYDFNLEFAENGKTGLDKALKSSIDLIISDVMMPEMDGIELCEALKNNAKTSNIPIMLLTAKTSEESKAIGLKAGVNDYITKPFNKKDLLERINNILKDSCAKQ